jgi:hypothetical protein
MSEKKPLIVNAEGYVLVLRTELSRLLAIESRARHKLSQLQKDTTAHIEALAFVLATDDALHVPENEVRENG